MGIKSGQTTIQMKTKVFKIASDGSPADSECPNCDPVNATKGNAFSLVGLRHGASIHRLLCVRNAAFGAGNLRVMNLFNNLQIRQLGANNPVTGGNSIQ
jgi:hypothetical protein